MDKRGIAFTTTEIRDGDVGEWFEQIQTQPWCLGAKIDRGGGNDAPCVIWIGHRPNDARVASWLKEHGLPVFPVEMEVRVQGDEYRLKMDSVHLLQPLDFVSDRKVIPHSDGQTPRANPRPSTE